MDAAQNQVVLLPCYQLLEQKIAAIGIGKIVTGMGRGIALDRDGNYQKTKCSL